MTLASLVDVEFSLFCFHTSRQQLHCLSQYNDTGCSRSRAARFRAAQFRAAQYRAERFSAAAGCLLASLTSGQRNSAML